MTDGEIEAWKRERIEFFKERNGHPTRVRVEDVIKDLDNLDEETTTGEYGYYEDDDGELIVQVWNDSYHGVKAEYKVKIELELLWGEEDYSPHG